MAFRILAVLAAVALSTSSFAANTTKTKKSTTTTTTAKPAAPAAAPAARPMAHDTYTVSSSSSKAMSVGLLAGMSFFGSTTTSASASYFTPGVEFSYNVMPMFTIGAEFQYPIISSPVLPAGVTSSIKSMVFLADAWYNIEQVQGLHAGVKLGYMTTKADVTVAAVTTSTTVSGFAIAPAVGYDYALNSDWSVGGQIDYLIQTKTDTAKAFQVFATGKYWF